MSFLVDKQGKEVSGTDNEHNAKVLESGGFTCRRVKGEDRGLVSQKALHAKLQSISERPLPLTATQPSAILEQKPYRGPPCPSNSLQWLLL